MDVLCQAKSGMGKTAVFVTATLQQIDPKDGEVSMLVLCHTRELAYQIRNEYARFSKYMPDVRTAVVYGGVSVKQDAEMLKDKEKCPHIIVGTPGRLNALVRDGLLKCNTVRTFVLDECDKMLESVGQCPQSFSTRTSSASFVPLAPIIISYATHRCNRHLSSETSSLSRATKGNLGDLSYSPSGSWCACWWPPHNICLLVDPCAPWTPSSNLLPFISFGSQPLRAFSWVAIALWPLDVIQMVQPTSTLVHHVSRLTTSPFPQLPSFDSTRPLKRAPCVCIVLARQASGSPFKSYLSSSNWSFQEEEERCVSVLSKKSLYPTWTISLLLANRYATWCPTGLLGYTSF